MPTDETGKRTAAEILAAALSDPRARALFGALFDEIVEYEEGDPGVVYGGTSAEGFGSFRCEFMPLAAVEKLSAECARVVDEFSINAKLPDGSMVAKRPADHLKPATRQRLAEEMAYYATQALLMSFRDRLTAAIEDAFAGALLIAEAMFAQLLAEFLEGREGFIGPIEADARQEIEAAARGAAGRERKRLKATLRGFDRLRAGAVGRPAGVATARVRQLLRKHGKLTKGKAAELLGCDEKAIREWAKRTEWGTWSKARDGLLEEISRGGRN
jgi:hypothetical protein